MHLKIRRNLSNLLLIGTLVFGVGCQMIQTKEYKFKFQDRNATKEEVLQELNELYLGKNVNEFINMLENVESIGNDFKGFCSLREPKYKEVEDPEYSVACQYFIGRPSLAPPFGVKWGFRIRTDKDNKITDFKISKNYGY
jgi:hypothetical protein